MPRFDKDGIRVKWRRRGKGFIRTRIFSRAFRLRVLSALEERGDGAAEAIRGEFKLTRPEWKRILSGEAILDAARNKALAMLEMKEREENMRDRLYERAVRAAADSLDPIEEVIAASPFLNTKQGMAHLATAIGHLRNRGQNAVKVLEGLGDFRRGGDEVPREAPRQPLFNLPPGSRVAVSLDIRTGGGNGTDGDCDRNGAAIERAFERGEGILVQETGAAAEETGASETGSG